LDTVTGFVFSPTRRICPAREQTPNGADASPNFPATIIQMPPPLSRFFLGFCVSVCHASSHTCGGKVDSNVCARVFVCPKQWQEMLAAAAADMAVGEQGYLPQPANSTSLENGFKAVIKSLSGPRATVQYLVNQLQKYRWVIAGCVGIALGMCKLPIPLPAAFYLRAHVFLPWMMGYVFCSERGLTKHEDCGA
jgi:hypothetical protein